MTSAWIDLREDEPRGTRYGDPASCYQALIRDHVYRSIDRLYLCSVRMLPTSDVTIPSGDGSSYTVILHNLDHNQPYMDNILRDAPADNPDIRIGVMLDSAFGHMINNVFSNRNVSPEKNAADFAGNVVAYLQHYGLMAFDVDWERPLCFATMRKHFKLLFSAIGAAFREAGNLSLTLSPAAIGYLDAETVNENFDAVHLQPYSGFASPRELVEAGIDATLFQLPAPTCPYRIFRNSRLSSRNVALEQQQRQAVPSLVFA
jgi:hypothetical protein